MEILDGGVELFRPFLELLLDAMRVLPPFDLIRHYGLDIHRVVLGKGGGRVDVGLRVMDGFGCVLAVHQLVLDVDVLLDEPRLVVQASAVLRSDGVRDGGLVDACLGVWVGDFGVGIAVFLPQHSKIRL